jgi:oligopeptide/dipeptide ABC transporter ATP-binding protein
MSAIPKIKAPNRPDRQILKGEVADIFAQPAGCSFNPRCPSTIDKCFNGNPPLVPVDGRPEHLLACWK